MSVILVENIPLNIPVEVDKVTYSSLAMRRPKVKDQKIAKKATKSNEDYETLLFANLCEVSVAVIDELDVADYGALQKFYRGCSSLNLKGLNRTILALAAFTGSGFNEILEMDVDDFLSYLKEMQALRNGE